MNDKQPVIIAAPYQKENIYRKLLKTQPGIIGVAVTPLYVWLNEHREKVPDKPTDFIICHKAITRITDQLTVLRKSAGRPSFTAEFISLYQELTENGIPIAALPDQTVRDHEIKQILTAIEPCLSGYQAPAAVIAAVPELTEVSIYPDFISSIADQQVIDEMIRKGAVMIPVATGKPAALHLYQALNKRQELESLAQYLVRQDQPLEDIVIVLADPAGYLPWLKAIFDRYKLPFSSLIRDNDSLVFARFRDLFNLLHTKESGAFSGCVANHCLHDDYPALRRYLDTFALPLTACLDPFTNIRTNNKTNIVFSGAEKIYAEQLEADAESQRLKLEPLIRSILSCSADLPSRAILAYDILKTQPLSANERADFHKIKELIEQVLPLTDDPDIFLYLLQRLTPYHKPVSTAQLVVTDLKHCSGLAQSRLILVGADSSVFPGISFHNGVADEGYYQQLAYPTKDQRYEFVWGQIKRLFTYYRDITISFAYGDYAGKGRKIAFELETFIAENGGGTFRDWPLQENAYLKPETHRLDPVTAEALFFTERVLKGSVSSFETFYSCPYRYFIERGLRINVFDLSLSRARVGVILHHIMEQLVSDLGAEYVHCPPDTLETVINDALAELYQIFLSRAATIDIIKQRLQELLPQILAVLAHIAQDDDLQPGQTELPFASQLKLDDLTLDMHGKIDRIDTDQEYYRIIDYKSSDHRLTEKAFTHGTELQLLTYLWLSAPIVDKQPEGAYYFSLSDKTTKVTAAKFNRRVHTQETYALSDWISEFYRTHGLSGWSLTADNQRNIHDIAAKLTELYQGLAHRLLAGAIEPQPQDDACKYCPYLSICKYYTKDHEDDEEVTE